mmetsp:Transcript_8936/g.19123  ORF Transcript_8936/g.19123 Transcript_8936/m.19123 type:complete len:568 (-) Transcript_8936:179-1882(-)
MASRAKIISKAMASRAAYHPTVAAVSSPSRSCRRRYWNLDSARSFSNSWQRSSERSTFKNNDCHDTRCRHGRRAISSSPRISKASAVPIMDDDGNSSSSSTDSIPFLLADIGEGISEVELLQWFVQPGDVVSQFDRICQVQSDKASVEITSRFDGTVGELCGEVGEMVKVGQPLLFIQVADRAGTGHAGAGPAEAAPSVAAKFAETSHASTASFLSNVDDVQDRLQIPTVATSYSNYYDDNSATNAQSHPDATNNEASKVLSSPAVRKLCKDHVIDLNTVIGTGPHGRVLKADVLKLIQQQQQQSQQQQQQFPQQTTAGSSPQTNIEQSSTSKTIPLRGYHRLMVKSMTTSLQIPHMVYTDEIHMDQLTHTRNTLRPLANAQYSIRKLTYMPFFVKAASLALKEFPMVNSTIDVEDMTMTFHDSHDIGVAVDTERGLAVPVVKACQDKSVLEIAQELQRLLEAAMEGNLSEEDIANPTFTLSNIGAIGGTYMSPVVVPPQVAIGAMGRIQRLPRFVDDSSEKVEAVRIMPMSWGGDHRAIDGATMAKFSNCWKSYCENPSSMLFAMR